MHQYLGEERLTQYFSLDKKTGFICGVFLTISEIPVNQKIVFQ